MIGVRRLGPFASAARVLAVTAIAAAVIAVGFVLFTSGRSYTVTAVMPDAGQLVKGSLVKVGGVKIGTVSSIDLDEHRQALVKMSITEPRFQPLHQGSRADVMYGSVSSIAGRVVAVTPGPDDASKIADGGQIDSDHTGAPVEVDTILNTLDAQTRTSLQRLFRGSAVALSGKEKAANRALENLNPALSQTARTMREVDRDQSAFERFITESASVVTAVAGRRTDLEQGIANGAQVAGEIASRTRDLNTLLTQAPPTMRRANTTLVNLRAALHDARPAIREARPVAPRLARVLRTLPPVTRNARPALADLRALLPDLNTTLRGMPTLRDRAVPAFRSATAALRDADPIVQGLLPIYPDLIRGPTDGFGGLIGGFYDANGGLVHTSFLFSGQSLTGLFNQGQGNNVGGGTFSGHTNRCPGGATQRSADGSSPFRSPFLPCDPTQSP